MNNLQGKKVAVLVTDGFEEVEFTKPVAVLKDAGAIVHVISPQLDTVRAWNKDNWGNECVVDRNVSEARASDYDSLLLPGGVMNPDQLRTNSDAVKFVKDFFAAGKPIAAICHAPQLLIETGALKGRELTSYPSLKTDIENAGAKWIDSEVVVDAGLVTSRTPDDIPAFNNKMLEEFAEGVHQEQMTV
ncbi:type 1 glutamine amidotransferase domain-containing protein [Chondrinema litorale]|uniref:type 1 glutamine amidotransferase domain-containing protein n=1 Tax=Chondrinema litorale TaxID=2994555 RepID=UPI0025435D77|nr:type 1 glutamine amidotransferase domain-containing protein [Chondrinema litorale]UZR99765.1 type 1 glutamine amidotransferase [Chondrinema litorale]